MDYLNQYFYEESHYKAIGQKNDVITLQELNTQKQVDVNKAYIDTFLTSTVYDKEVKIGYLDKHWTEKQIEAAINSGEISENEVRVGDLKTPGILTVWDNIRDKRILKIVFETLPKAKSKKEHSKELLKIKEKYYHTILSLDHTNNKYEEALNELLTDFQKEIPSEFETKLRKLIGYKITFDSKDSMYRVWDLENQGQRMLSVNRIKSLIVDGTKYIIE